MTPGIKARALLIQPYAASGVFEKTHTFSNLHRCASATCSSDPSRCGKLPGVLQVDLPGCTLAPSPRLLMGSRDCPGTVPAGSAGAGGGAGAELREAHGGGAGDAHRQRRHQPADVAAPPGQRWRLRQRQLEGAAPEVQPIAATSCCCSLRLRCSGMLQVVAADGLWKPLSVLHSGFQVSHTRVAIAAPGRTSGLAPIQSRDTISPGLQLNLNDCAT